MSRPINEAGLELIKSFEGCKLHAYKDEVGVWTVGFGSTKNVHPGMTISEAEAEERLRDDLHRFEDQVIDMVETDTNDNQYAALVSFAYNLGSLRLEKSTLLRKVNSEDFDGAADEFLKWNRAGGVISDGLTRRREAERELFLTPVEE